MAPKRAISLAARASKKAWHSGPHSRVFVIGLDDGNPILWPTTIIIGLAAATATIPAPTTEPTYLYINTKLIFVDQNLCFTVQ